MSGIVAVAKNLVISLVVPFGAIFLFAPTVFAQSTINTQLCQDSQLTISQPPHDGTVNNPVVHFSGTVAYSSQIEVYVDSNYSTQIPLSSGATTYASDITIGKGTHTIKLVAINHCSGSSNAESALVVTYVPAKVSGPTSTNVSENGSKVDSSNSIQTQTQAPLSGFDNALKSVASWLNFKVDNQQESQSRLSVVRAITLAVGLIVSVFGMALIVVDWFSRVTAGFLLPGLVGDSRILVFRIFFRVIGIITVLLSLFVP